MKMAMTEMAMVVGAMSVLGYCFMKKHPEMVKQMKDAIKETSKMIYTKLENGD